MKSKKESKRIKHGQQASQKQNPQKFLSPLPKKFHKQIEQSLANLRDLSPIIPLYGSCQIAKHVHFSNQLAMIETPAYTCPRMIEEQIDEGHHQISGIINWENQESEGSEEYEDDSQIMQISNEENGLSDELGKREVMEKVDLKFSTPNPKNKLQKQSTKKTPRPFPQTAESKKVTCNCKRTQCLKLYCDCFRLNQNCDGCNCIGCHNLTEFQQQRNNAMLSLMDRNPEAFKPKITQQQHSKGCNCKKSNCLKKYCQCYQAGLKCGPTCKCQECKNGCEGHKDQENNQIGVNLSNQIMKDKEQCVQEA